MSFRRCFNPFRLGPAQGPRLLCLLFSHVVDEFQRERTPRLREMSTAQDNSAAQHEDTSCYYFLLQTKKRKCGVYESMCELPGTGDTLSHPPYQNKRRRQVWTCYIPSSLLLVVNEASPVSTRGFANKPILFCLTSCTSTSEKRGASQRDRVGSSESVPICPHSKSCSAACGGDDCLVKDIILYCGDKENQAAWLRYLRTANCPRGRRISLSQSW